MDWLISTEAPWWASFVGLLIGAALTFLVTRSNDKARFDREQAQKEKAAEVDDAKEKQRRLLVDLEGVLLKGRNLERSIIDQRRRCERNADGSVTLRDEISELDSLMGMSREAYGEFAEWLDDLFVFASQEDLGAIREVESAGRALWEAHMESDEIVNDRTKRLKDALEVVRQIMRDMHQPQRT